MAITDKTRKTLWARSGNRCLLCKVELVQADSNTDANVVIGEECHIISSKSKGPRGEIAFGGDFDAYENLLLLCANDHKKIDELTKVYTVEKLQLAKATHEAWVKSTLEKDVTAFANDKANIKSLPKITSGKQIVDIINGAHLFDFDHDEVETKEEASAIGELFGDLKDCGDIISDMSYTDVVELGLRYNDEIERLNGLGFVLFGLRRRLRLHDGKKDDMGIFISASLVAVRFDNPAIVDNFLIAKFPQKFSFI
jgi:hypothetical protein